MTANPPAQSQTAVKESLWVRHRTLIALVAILIVAAFFRFYGRDFDQDTHQHPDERFIVDQTLGLSWPTTSAQFFDVANSPLNLRRAGKHYPYGSLPVYLTKGVAWAVDTYLPPDSLHGKGWWLGYEGVTKIGRMLAGFFDLITVLLVFLIARRLYSRTAGLIAAALVGFAVTHIQIAHFYASDAFLVTFMMGALYFAVVLMQRPSLRAATGVGLCIGLAVASKVSVVLFALIVIAAIGLRAAYRQKTRVLGAEFDDPIGVKPADATERARSASGHFVRGLRYAVIAAVFALLAFAVSEPYVLPSFQYSEFSTGGVTAVLNSSPFWGGIVEQAGIQSGHDENDVPYTRQYVGTIPVLYHMQNLVFWGLSPIPGVIVVLGFIVGLWFTIRRRPAEILLMAGALPYWATILVVETKWMRYVLPLVPIYCILGAGMLMRGAAFMQALTARTAWLRSSRRPMAVLQRNLFPVLSVVTVGAAFLWAVAFMNIYSQEH
ncbi:MAG: ArnT family glycosyltransferase, partial [Chloroflexia bacterium]